MARTALSHFRAGAARGLRDHASPPVCSKENSSPSGSSTYSRLKLGKFGRWEQRHAGCIPQLSGISRSADRFPSNPDQGEPVMAMANSAGTNNLEKVSWYLNHHMHTVWDRFNADQQDRMIDDDLRAGTSVSMVLISVITTGMVLATITLLVVLATS
jgi:hypothetical protein